MKVYKSSLGYSFGLRLVRHIWLFQILGFLSFIPIIRKLINSIGEINWIILLVGYLFLTLLYLGFFNNNFFFRKGTIEIRSSLFSFLKPKKVKYSLIKEVRMPHEKKEEDSIFSFSTLFLFFFPWDYKWIEIKTKSNRTYTYYCFGLEYVYYDNFDENDLMENVFKEFIDKGVNIKWTKAGDNYFDRMTKEARMKYNQSQIH